MSTIPTTKTPSGIPKTTSKISSQSESTKKSYRSEIVTGVIAFSVLSILAVAVVPGGMGIAGHFLPSTFMSKITQIVTFPGAISITVIGIVGGVGALGSIALVVMRLTCCKKKEGDTIKKSKESEPEKSEPEKSEPEKSEPEKSEPKKADSKKSESEKSERAESDAVLSDEKGDGTSDSSILAKLTVPELEEFPKSDKGSIPPPPKNSIPPNFGQPGGLTPARVQKITENRTNPSKLKTTTDPDLLADLKDTKISLTPPKNNKSNTPLVKGWTQPVAVKFADGFDWKKQVADKFGSQLKEKECGAVVVEHDGEKTYTVVAKYKPLNSLEQIRITVPGNTGRHPWTGKNDDFGAQQTISKYLEEGYKYISLVDNDLKTSM